MPVSPGRSGRGTASGARCGRPQTPVPGAAAPGPAGKAQKGAALVCLSRDFCALESGFQSLFRSGIVISQVLKNQKGVLTILWLERVVFLLI